MEKKRNNSNFEISAIDIFCGAGGLTRGLENAGIDVKLGIDIDPDCEYPYTRNNEAKFLLKSIRDVEVDEILGFYPKKGVRLLAGCAPCQTFSTYYQKANLKDERWWLLKEFGRLVEGIKPEIITMENVPGLSKQKVFINFLKLLKNMNYYVSYELVNCSEYGVPQNRHRLVLLASIFGPISLIPSHEYGQTRMTVADAISGLPPLNDGDICKEDPLHQCSKLSEINLKRIKSSKPQGTWRDWDKSLIANCHHKKTGETYSSVYGRMCWDKPAPTMTTQFFGFGNGRFGHPVQNRAISLREGALLQSFPVSYEFVENDDFIYKKRIGRLIGNAVPVKLGEVIGKSIIKHYNTNKRSYKSKSTKHKLQCK